MTLCELLTSVDESQPNDIPRSEKLRWLTTVEGIIKKELLQARRPVEFDGYDESTDALTPLLADEPYAELYRYYLEAQIHDRFGETIAYNNSMTKYNTLFTAYERYLDRTEKPLGKPIHFRYY